ARALRAAGLVERLAREGTATSQELARLHLDRLVDGASFERVSRTAARRARLYRWLGVALAAAAGVVGVVASRELLEGFDVLFARHERAPLPLVWTERLRIMAQAPAYLRIPPRRL